MHGDDVIEQGDIVVTNNKITARRAERHGRDSGWRDEDGSPGGSDG